MFIYIYIFVVTNILVMWLRQEGYTN